MGKPEGVLRKTKDNSKKNHQAHTEWVAGKKIGRKKQVFVDIRGQETRITRWEKK